jgi:hypothetical protein
MIFRSKRGLRILLLTTVLALVGSALALTLLYVAWPSTIESGYAVLRAAIIDGLYEAYPNTTLIEVLEKLLEDYGYVVEVYLGRNATLEVFRKITSFSIVVMRVHGGYMETAEGYVVGLYTGSPWSTRYVGLAAKGYVAEGVPFVPPPRGPKVFVAVLPKFFRELVDGGFREGSILIAAGCYTGLDPNLVSALCSKGLAVYIGFRDNVDLYVIDALLPDIVEAVLDSKLEELKVLESRYGLVAYRCRG